MRISKAALALVRGLCALAFLGACVSSAWWAWTSATPGFEMANPGVAVNAPAQRVEDPASAAPAPPVETPSVPSQAAGRSVDTAAAPEPASPDHLDVETGALGGPSAPVAAPAPAPSSGSGNLGCEKYKTFDPGTRTYRGFDGAVHPCPVRR